MEVPSAHLLIHKEMTINGHLQRGNHLYSMTKHHTVTLNIVLNSFLKILLIKSDARRQNGRGGFTRRQTQKEEDLQTEP
jgi:hypothetical protein